MMDPALPPIRRLTAHEAMAHVDALATLLLDAVAHGASVNFLAGLTRDEARDFWAAHLVGVEAGTRAVFVAEAAGRLFGSVVLSFAPQPNGLHRADIGKMLVHTSARRRGLGRRLLAAAEAAALEAGRTLLLLDTESGSAGERLYRASGWTPYGTVPGFALDPAGVPADATFFFKRLSPPLPA